MKKQLTFEDIYIVIDIDNVFCFVFETDSHYVTLAVPGTQYVDQTRLKLRDSPTIPTSAS